jgi:hypothetical protein
MVLLPVQMYQGLLTTCMLLRYVLVSTLPHEIRPGAAAGGSICERLGSPGSRPAIPKLG